MGQRWTFRVKKNIHLESKLFLDQCQHLPPQFSYENIESCQYMLQDMTNVTYKLRSKSTKCCWLCSIVGIWDGKYFFFFLISLLSPFANPAKISKVWIMVQGFFVQKGFWATISLVAAWGYLSICQGWDLCLKWTLEILQKGASATSSSTGSLLVSDGSWFRAFIPTFRIWRVWVPSDVEGCGLVFWSTGQLWFSCIMQMVTELR